MAELEKIKRVVAKRIPGAPHETLLVLDATTGQNAIQQALEFSKILDVTGLFLTKLDGTAKGGAVIGIRDQVAIPVKFIGVGEKPEDVEDFDAAAFVRGLVGREESLEPPAGRASER
jgi:fused signal recognition particle receptor